MRALELAASALIIVLILVGVYVGIPKRKKTKKK